MTLEQIRTTISITRSQHDLIKHLAGVKAASSTAVIIEALTLGLAALRQRTEQDLNAMNSGMPVAPAMPEPAPKAKAVEAKQPKKRKRNRVVLPPAAFESTPPSASAAFPTDKEAAMFATLTKKDESKS